MPELKIHVLGYDEICLLLGLLGIDSTIVNTPEDFLKEFNKKIKDKSIGMIIVALNLSDDFIDILINFKLNNRRPFVYYLPDIFQLNIESENVFLKKISEFVGKII